MGEKRVNDGIPIQELIEYEIEVSSKAAKNTTNGICRITTFKNLGKMLVVFLKDLHPFEFNGNLLFRCNPLTSNKNSLPGSQGLPTEAPFAINDVTR